MAHHHNINVKVRNGDSPTKTIALVGNPNVGKSVVFGYLTGKYVTVSNFPGTTVEITKGRMTGDHGQWEIVDTPGVNNFIPSSEDEAVTRNILMHESPERIMLIMDTKNLRRGLLLSVQLAEMGLPYSVSLNMADEARDRGITIDREKLAEVLGVSVVETIATQKIGLEDARRAAMHDGHMPKEIVIKYPAAIEQAVSQLISMLPNATLSPRALALMILAGDTTLDEWVAEHVPADKRAVINQIIQTTRVGFTRSLNVEITHARMRRAVEIKDLVLVKRKTKLTTIGNWLNRATIHPIGGLFFVTAVLLGMYEFVGVFGAGYLVDALEKGLFGKYLVPGMTSIIQTILPWQLGQDFLIGKYGLLSMALSYSIAIVLPIVGTYFIAFGLLEDSGYLPRLSVMMNRVFKAMGLNGKAVLPMVLGLGCDTMATMTTRILDSRKERLIVTLLLALAVPCSAQLGVILAMLQGISFAASFIWLSVVVGVIFIVGYLAAKVIPGQTSDFVLELPPMRRPILSNIVVKTMARLEWYLREAVPLFFLGTFILFIMDKLALLTLIEQGAAPIIQTFLGLPKEATAAFIMGFLRRDYGAAGLFMLARDGQLDPIQVLVSLVVITLFMPCIANFFMIIKEHGWKVAAGMTAFILPFALMIGGMVNWILRTLNVVF